MPQSPSADRPPASAIDAAAADWLMRRDQGFSTSDQKQFATWLAEDEQHRTAFTELERTWAVFDRANKKGLKEPIATELSVRSRARRTKRKAGAGLLALLLGVFIVGSWLSTPTTTPTPQVEQVAAGPIRKLPDGSIVELNTGAEIAVKYEPGIRRIELLTGEAHFRVEKDAARPFVVVARGVEVKAVGTAFTVQLQSEKVEVVVTEGRVEVEPPNQTSKAANTFLNAGSSTTVATVAVLSAPPPVATLTDAQLESRLSWRIPRLEFGGMELGQAVRLMNAQNRLQITLTDTAIQSLRVSGTFRSDNPEGFVRIVEGTFDLVAERKSEHEIVLRMK